MYRIISTIAFASIVASPSFANDVNVPGTASGGFGEPSKSGAPMVPGWTFVGGGESIVISAEGVICSAGFCAGPCGAPCALNVCEFANSYNPLEEHAIDDGTMTLPRTTDFALIEALMGAFVPASLESNPLFNPYDEDLVVLGIPSDALFLIGGGPVQFTAPGPGTLYLGINEPNMTNNSGSFTVTIEPGEIACPADVAAADDVVNIDDLIAVIVGWGACEDSCEADTNGDCTVDVTDLVSVVVAWGACP